MELDKGAKTIFEVTICSNDNNSMAAINHTIPNSPKTSSKTKTIKGNKSRTAYTTITAV